MEAIHILSNYYADYFQKQKPWSQHSCKNLCYWGSSIPKKAMDPAISIPISIMCPNVFIKSFIFIQCNKTGTGLLKRLIVILLQTIEKIIYKKHLRAINFKFQIFPWLSLNNS